MRFEDQASAPAGGPAAKRHARVEDLATAETIIDARSPGEFALDHIPGAINCPVLSNDERALVGTLYAERGPFEARRVGGGLVAANLARHLATTMHDRPAGWRPIVYCWRGGLRSGSMVQWLRLVGWDARQLGGGYKQWRKHVISTIDERAPTLDLRVLSGPTGSAKTRVLTALAALGAQTLDLEAEANHRGSVLGLLPGAVQPSQKQFETRIAMALATVDAARPVYVESESRRIGRLSLPTALFERMRASPLVEIRASATARLALLLKDYAWLGDDRADLVARIALLRGPQSGETIERWTAWASAGDLQPLFADMIALHYDPLYARSQRRPAPSDRADTTVSADRLCDADVDRIAREIAAAD